MLTARRARAAFVVAQLAIASTLTIGTGLLVKAFVGLSHVSAGFNTEVFVVFALIALFLSAMGIYAVIAFTVSERTREIGVRVALGADPAAILRLVVGEGVTLAAAGLALGMAGGAMLARSLATLLSGVQAWNAGVFTAVLALLAAVAFAAAYVPARRAARLDPAEALRT